MPNVQHYKGQIQVHGATMPFLGGGGNLAWDLNQIVPDIVGNIGGNQNYSEGIQMPTVDVNYGLLNAAAATCPIDYTHILTFLQRTTGATHDVSDQGVLKFFDGHDGWTFTNNKPSSFSVSCTKGSMVSMNASYGVYVPVGGTDPAQLTTPLTYSAFTGDPITWQSVCYFSDAGLTTAIPYIWSATIQYSNNLDPDMSQYCESGVQKKYPIDLNARRPSASIRLVFPAGAVSAGSYPVTQGQVFAMKISSNSIGCTLVAPKVIWRERDGRQIGVGRQMRVFDGQCLAAGNYSGGAPGADFSNNCLYALDL